MWLSTNWDFERIRKFMRDVKYLLLCGVREKCKQISRVEKWIHTVIKQHETRSKNQNVRLVKGKRIPRQIQFYHTVWFLLDSYRYRFWSFEFSFNRLIECWSFANLNRINSIDPSIDWWAHKKVCFNWHRKKNRTLSMSTLIQMATIQTQCHAERIAGSMNWIHHFPFIKKSFLRMANLV